MKKNKEIWKNREKIKNRTNFSRAFKKNHILLTRALLELREKSKKIQEDIENKCFICGIERRQFDVQRQSKGFAYHVEHEHNIWNYLAFNMYLRTKEKTEYNGPEQYVAQMV